MTVQRPNPPLRRPTPPASTPTEAEDSKPGSANTAEASNTTITGAKPRDLDRARAHVAWENIQAVKPQSYREDYGSLARKMPTFIQNNGLAQTLAFLEAKGKRDDCKNRKEHFVQMADHLSYWICHHRFPGDQERLLDRVLKMDSQTYRLVTHEALAFLQWLKRFAEAELGDKEGN